MNITVIYGQHHKGNTWTLTQLFLEYLKDSDTHVTEFFLPEESLGYCTGCLNCIMGDEMACPHSSVMQKIVESLDSADLIIIASPCYVFGMTGQLKVLFDHFGYRYMAHRPEPSMFRKQALALSTAAGMGMNNTTRAISFNMFMWGVARTYRYGLRIGAANFQHIPVKRKEEIERKARRIAKRIIKNSRCVNAGIKTRLIFSFMRLRQKNNDWNVADQTYWQTHGWLDKARPF
jgi:multimeric flavodoxin WrbA